MRQGVPYSYAVLLECEPDGGQWLPSTDQAWPTDALRHASTLGFEPVVCGDGLPLIGPTLLATPDVLWHNLTLGFATRAEVELRNAWAPCRDVLLESLAPNTWPAPPSCETILHVTEGDYLLLLTRSSAALQQWLARQVATLLAATLSYADAEQIATWCLAEAVGVGIHLKDVTRDGELLLRGRWGRPEWTPLRAGDPPGDRFEVRLKRAA
jgi:hypothetical protein